MVFTLSGAGWTTGVHVPAKTGWQAAHAPHAITSIASQDRHA
jgi:hypothetical protein